jgi:hypothetical protein
VKLAATRDDILEIGLHGCYAKRKSVVPWRHLAREASRYAGWSRAMDFLASFGPIDLSPVSVSYLPPGLIFPLGKTALWGS